MFNPNRLVSYDQLLYRWMRISIDELKELYTAKSDWVAKYCVFYATRPAVILSQNLSVSAIQNVVEALALVSEKLDGIYRELFRLLENNDLVSEWPVILEEIWDRKLPYL